jgi:hypothetical protein
VTRPDETVDLVIVCVPSGGGVFIGGADGTWYCSGRKIGWFSGTEGEMFRCDFITVARAVNFARSCGWIDE